MANLPVYFEQRRVGAIDVDKNGPRFSYDPDWIALRGAFPISVTMPFRSERIASDIFLPWAANLLPESEQLRTLGQFSRDGAERCHRVCSPRSAAILRAHFRLVSRGELLRFSGGRLVSRMILKKSHE